MWRQAVRGIPAVGLAAVAAHAGALAPFATAGRDAAAAPSSSSGSSTWKASWTAAAAPKGAQTAPAVVAPPLALQEEFDVVIVSPAR